MNVAAKSRFVFKSNKWKIRQPEISIYGAICTGKGIKPNPIKVQSLQGLPTSNNQTKLQCLLGLITYLQPFIPSLSTKTNFLRDQFTEWNWNPYHTQHSST